MRFGTRRRQTENGLIDGGEGRGVRMGGSDTGVPATGFAKRERRATDAFDDDESLIEAPTSPFDDYEEFSEDNDASPGDRRRDPLRKSI